MPPKAVPSQPFEALDLQTSVEWSMQEPPPSSTTYTVIPNAEDAAPDQPAATDESEDENELLWTPVPRPLSLDRPEHPNAGFTADFLPDSTPPPVPPDYSSTTEESGSQVAVESTGEDDQEEDLGLPEDYLNMSVSELFFGDRPVETTEKCTHNMLIYEGLDSATQFYRFICHFCRERHIFRLRDINTDVARRIADVIEEEGVGFEFFSLYYLLNESDRGHIP